MIEMIARMWRRLGFYFRREERQTALSEEIRFHLEMRAKEGGGVGDDQARFAARRRFGNPVAVSETAQDVWVVRWIDAVARDIGLGLRGLRRSPAFTAAALTTLVLGIGGTVTIFSFVHAALLAPFPYPVPDRLVNLHLVAQETVADPSLFAWSYPKYALMRKLATSFDQIAAFNTTNINLRQSENPERVILEEASAEYFSILGATPAVGRLYGPSEDSVPNGNAVVVLSHALWRRVFGGDSSIVGRSVSLGGLPFTVLGVMAPTFRSLSGEVELWAPMSMTPTLEYKEILEEAGNHWFGVVARLKSGTTLAGATSEMVAIGAKIDEQFHFRDQAKPWSATMAPLSDVRVDPAIRRAALVLFAAVGFVLLIACANVASLLLVRGSGRQREMAIRTAVGAGRGAIVRQLLIESLVLSTIGGILAIGGARIATGFLTRFSPGLSSGQGGVGYQFSMDQVGQSTAVLGFAVVITAVTGLLAGLLPARAAARSSVVTGLKSSRQGAAGGPLHWLIGAEAALALILAVGAGLMIRSFAKLASTDVGFSSARVLDFRISPADQDWAAKSPAEFKARAIVALRAIPGVEVVGVNTCAPLTDGCNGSVVVDKQNPDGGLPIQVHFADEGYFATLGVPLRAGRLFGPTDRLGSGRVAIVGEITAQKLWPGQNPIGQRLAVATSYFAGGDSIATVIGVVGDVRYQAVERPADLDVYVPALQRSFGRSHFFVRTKGDPLGYVEPIRQAIRLLDPGLPIYGVTTLERLSAQATARTRLLTLLLAAFSAMALLLAAVGIYGVVAFAVAGRVKEIGVRLAIGAEPTAVVAMMIRQGAVPLGLGVGLGLAVALGLTGLLRGLLYQVAPLDFVSLAGGVVALGVVGLIACWIPARRAAGVDPVSALRTD